MVREMKTGRLKTVRPCGKKFREHVKAKLKTGRLETVRPCARANEDWTTERTAKTRGNENEDWTTEKL